MVGIADKQDLQHGLTVQMGAKLDQERAGRQQHVQRLKARFEALTLSAIEASTARPGTRSQSRRSSAPTAADKGPETGWKTSKTVQFHAESRAKRSAEDEVEPGTAGRPPRVREQRRLERPAEEKRAKKVRRPEGGDMEVDEDEAGQQHRAQPARTDGGGEGDPWVAEDPLTKAAKGKPNSPGERRARHDPKDHRP